MLPAGALPGRSGRPTLFTSMLLTPAVPNCPACGCRLSMLLVTAMPSTITPPYLGAMPPMRTDCALSSLKSTSIPGVYFRSSATLRDGKSP